MAIKNLLVDLDGTLIDLDIYRRFAEPVYQKIREVTGLYGEVLDQRAERLGAVRNQFGRWDTGDLCRRLDLVADYFQVLEETVQREKYVFEQSLPFLRQVRSKVPIVGVVSNSLKRTIRLHIDRNGFGPYLDFNFSSEDAGTFKTDQAYWKTLIERENIHPEESMVIGDEPEQDIVVPNQLGFQTFLVEQPSDLIVVANQF